MDRAQSGKGLGQVSRRECVCVQGKTRAPFQGRGSGEGDGDGGEYWGGGKKGGVTPCQLGGASLSPLGEGD